MYSHPSHLCIINAIYSFSKKCGVSTIITDNQKMEAQILQIRDQQKEIWNRFSPGWKRWDDMTMNFLKPMGDEIIRIIKPKGADVVLDVASGTGEPALTIATKLRGGMVVATDISEGMLDVTRENAAKRGIKNIEIVACDVSELPFPDNSFDSVSCRFGFMFFPDMLLAAKEMIRVLKPGGRIAVTVWNSPEKNFWATAVMSIINRDMQLVPPPAEAPGLFRCAKSGLIADIFRQVGLKNVKETEVTGKLDTGTTEVYWNFMTEVVAPVVAALGNADDAMKLRIKDEVFNSVNQKYQNSRVSFDCSSLLIYGEK
jgi:ubiquinone/menaquinone biosynthesis C-methylase UbiE